MDSIKDKVDSKGVLVDATLSFDVFIQTFSTLSQTDKVNFLLENNRLGDFLLKIAPAKSEAGKTPYPYLLNNKPGLSLLAKVRDFITRSYSVEASVNDIKFYLSVLPNQWFEDGVLLTQGDQPYQGALVLYREKKVYFGIAKRDIRPNEKLTAEDFLFLDLKSARKHLKKTPIQSLTISANEAIRKLETMLQRGESRESQYQKFLCSHPWVLGGIHITINGHDKLDDINIPDFAAQRVRDGSRDIIEIKAPTIGLFNKDNSFSKNFNEAWNQLERYLDLPCVIKIICIMRKDGDSTTRIVI
jgi:hypothetical protein